MSSRGPIGRPVGHPILERLREAVEGMAVVFPWRLEPHQEALMRALGVEVVYPRPIEKEGASNRV